MIRREIEWKFFHGVKSKNTCNFLIKNSKRWKIVVNLIYWEYLLYANLRKNIEKWKKHSVLIIFPCHDLNQNSSTSDLSFSQVTSVKKRKSRKHFSASAYGLGLKKLFLGFLFSTSVTWEKLKSDVEKFYFRHDMEKNQNKILFLKAIKINFKYLWQNTNHVFMRIVKIKGLQF